MGESELLEDEKLVRGMLDLFGERLIELARSVWKIQADALSETSFAR